MDNIKAGDLVWIPADTIVEYEEAHMMGRTKLPTYGLVLNLDDSIWGGHVVVLRHNEKVSVQAKDLRKIN